MAISPQEFTTIRTIARREVERHTNELIGITTSEARFEEVNSVHEYVIDVRLWKDNEWETVKNVLLAQNVTGIIDGVSIPVILKPGKSGRLQVVGRADITIAEEGVYSRVRSYSDLGISFLALREQDSTGTWVDGFGYAVGNPSSETGVSDDVAYQLVTSLIEWGSTDFDYGVTHFGATYDEWRTV